MSSTPNHVTLRQSKLHRIRVNIANMTKEEAENGVFLFNIPVVFPEGPDWDNLNAEKIQIQSCNVEIKPYYNFTSMAGSGMGKVSGDFPIYLDFFMGNTVGEDDGTEMSKYILAGKYARGSATTGVRSTYGGQYFKTIFAEVPTSEDGVKRGNIANKENAAETIDDVCLENPRIVLQKGRIVIAIRKADFMVMEKSSYIDGDSSSNGSARAVFNYLKNKVGFAEPANADLKVKKSKKTPAPEPADFTGSLIEEPIVVDDGEGKSHKELYIDLPFWLFFELEVDYWRRG